MLRKIKYYFFSIIYGIQILFGVWLPYLAFFLTFIFILKYFKNFEIIGNSIIAYLVGLLVAGIIIKGLEKFYCFGNIVKYREKYRDFPFTEKYGKEFKKPELKEFDLTENEFFSYNRRFQLVYIKYITLLGLTIIFFEDIKIKRLEIILKIIILILVYYLFEFLNRELSKKNINFKKVDNYSKNLKIYNNIQKEMKKKLE